MAVAIRKSEVVKGYALLHNIILLWYVLTSTTEDDDIFIMVTVVDSNTTTDGAVIQSVVTTWAEEVVQPYRCGAGGRIKPTVHVYMNTHEGNKWEGNVSVELQAG